MRSCTDLTPTTAYLYLKDNGDILDWSKAKSILIVALIVTNLLLAVAIFSNQKPVDATLSKEFIEQSASLLKEKDIGLLVDIPRESPGLPRLTVDYEILNISLLRKNFFNGEGDIVTNTEGLVEIATEEEYLRVINDKLITYESKSEDLLYDIKSEEEAIDMAKDFIASKGYPLEDLKLSFIKESKGVYSLEFTKVYEDRYIESTFTNIQLDNRGIRRFERMWLNIKEIGTNPIYISSAPKSILSLTSMTNIYGKDIKYISLSYYFDPKIHDYIGDPNEAQEGRTMPAWRILFDDGYKVILDK